MVFLIKLSKIISIYKLYFSVELGQKKGNLSKSKKKSLRQNKK